MDLFEAIKERYSYRGDFQEKPVPRQDLRKIVQAGLDAPSGCNAQTTRFVIVDDADLLARIGAMEGANPALRGARALIACFVDRRPEAVYGENHFQIEDCAAAVENMLLAVTALGYATVWIDGWLRNKGRAEALGELLGAPDDRIVRVILPLGVPAEAGPRKEKLPFGQRAWLNRWEAPEA